MINTTDDEVEVQRIPPARATGYYDDGPLTAELAELQRWLPASEELTPAERVKKARQRYNPWNGDPKKRK